MFAGRLGVFPDARRPRESNTLYGHTLVARDLGSGRLRWTLRGDGYLDSAPLIAGATMFVGSGSGRLYGVNMRRGRVVWCAFAGAPVPFPTPAGTVSGLAVAGGTLLVPAPGRLVAYR